eukprot:UN25035
MNTSKKKEKFTVQSVSTSTDKSQPRSDRGSSRSDSKKRRITRRGRRSNSRKMERSRSRSNSYNRRNSRRGSKRNGYSEHRTNGQRTFTLTKDTNKDNGRIGITDRSKDNNVNNNRRQSHSDLYNDLPSTKYNVRAGKENYDGNDPRRGFKRSKYSPNRSYEHDKKIIDNSDSSFLRSSDGHSYNSKDSPGRNHQQSRSSSSFSRPPVSPNIDINHKQTQYHSVPPIQKSLTSNNNHRNSTNMSTSRTKTMVNYSTKTTSPRSSRKRTYSETTKYEKEKVFKRDTDSDVENLTQGAFMQKKKKRASHRLIWKDVIDHIGISSENIVLSQASDKYYACFFHAVKQRELSYSEVRQTLQSIISIIKSRREYLKQQEDLSANGNSNINKLENLIKQWLNKTEENLPRALWSPAMIKRCTSIL